MLKVQSRSKYKHCLVVKVTQKLLFLKLLNSL